MHRLPMLILSLFPLGGYLDLVKAYIVTLNATWYVFHKSEGYF